MLSTMTDASSHTDFQPERKLNADLNNVEGGTLVEKTDGDSDPEQSIAKPFDEVPEGGLAGWATVFGA